MSDKLRETPLSRQNVYNCGIFSVDELQVRLPDGRTAGRNVVNHNGGVGIVALDENENVVLVRQYRVAIGDLIWEIPAGKLDSPEEDPEAAAARELEEETGLHALHMEKLLAGWTSPGFSTEQLHLYLATGLSQHETHPDDDEFLQIKTLPLRDAVAAVMKGELGDMKTACALLLAQQKIKSAPFKE